nr:phage portal protein [Luteolibacter marinus]
MGGGAKLTKPYALSPWVHRAVRYVSGPLEMVPIEWSQDSRSGDVPVEDDDCRAFWEKPAVTRGGTLAKADFIRSLVGWSLLEGEFFLVLDDTWLSRREKKSPLIVARPDQMREILGSDGDLLGWFYTDRRGKRETLIPAQVVHQKQWNPYNEYRGLADWKAAQLAAGSDYAAGVFARNLMSNNGDRGPYVIGKDGTASDEQQKQITAMLRQKRELAQRGDFRAVFLTGDIEVKEPGLQSVDASYVAQRMNNAAEVFLAFGVPPSFTTITASYSVGSASDRFKLIEETCMPLAAMICDALEQVEFLRSGQQRFAAFDFDEHSVMQQVRAERLESATKMVDRGVPWREASEYLRLKLPPFPGDDIGRVPFNLVPVEIETNRGDAEVAEGNAEEEPDPVGDLEKAFKVREAGRKATLKAAETAKANEQWQQIHRSREPWEKRMKSKVSRYLMDARAETLRKLGAAAAGKSVETRDALDVLFDLAPWLEKWIQGLSQIDRNAMEAAGAELWTDELGKDDPLTMPADEVALAIARRENRLKNAGERVWRDVKTAVETAIDEGQTNEQLAATIKSTFQGIDEVRARTIANTEITVSYEVARDMTFRAAGVEWTKWLAAGDGRERDSHRAAHGQIREAGEPFDVGDAKLQFPGDPEGPPEEVINCRCVRVAVAGPDTSDIEGNDNDDIPY